MDGVRIGGGFTTLPLPLADKIAKFVATAHLVLEHPDGDLYLPEMKIWLNDPQVKQWTHMMMGRALAEKP